MPCTRPPPRRTTPARPPVPVRRTDPGPQPEQMHVTHLSLVDFRSYPTAELALGRGVTALIGPNGQGKTNLIEAIGYVASHGSHRVSTDAPLVRSGASRAVVRCGVMRGERSTLVELEIVPGGSNRVRVNRSPQTRPREALGVLR